MRIRVDLDLNEDQVENLLRKALMAGFLRTDPRKGWTDNEKKEAIREYVKEECGS